MIIRPECYYSNLNLVLYCVRTDTTAAMQETPKMGAVVDNPVPVAIVATAGTNFYLVFAGLAGLLGNWKHI